LTAYDSMLLVVQVVGAIALLLTLVVYYRQLLTMNRQRQASEREIAARMRPWVGLFDFSLERTAPYLGQKHDDVLRLLLRNFGPLPAQQACLSLILKPTGLADAEPIHWKEQGLKALMPDEEGNYGIRLSEYPRYSVWLEAQCDIEVEGTMVYALGDTRFRTEFLAALLLSKPLTSDGKVRTKWRNQDAV